MAWTSTDSCEGLVAKVLLARLFTLLLADENALLKAFLAETTQTAEETVSMVSNKPATEWYEAVLVAVDVTMIVANVTGDAWKCRLAVCLALCMPGTQALPFEGSKMGVVKTFCTEFSLVRYPLEIRCSEVPWRESLVLAVGNGGVMLRLVSIDTAEMLVVFGLYVASLYVESDCCVSAAGDSVCMASGNALGVVVEAVCRSVALRK